MSRRHSTALEHKRRQESRASQAVFDPESVQVPRIVNDAEEDDDMREARIDDDDLEDDDDNDGGDDDDDDDDKIIRKKMMMRMIMTKRMRMSMRCGLLYEGAF